MCLGLLIGREALGAQTPIGGGEGKWRSVSIRLNGRPFIEGFALGNSAQVVVTVESLAQSIDGTASTPTQRRLRVHGRSLSASATGSCPGCPIRVARVVLISDRIRAVKGALTAPLHDIVNAFEGRLDADASRDHYEIHVGKCTWCILEPVPSSSMR